jgi:XapX domain-containing protein
MLPCLLSLSAGLAVGAAYRLIGVESPAPPIIALVGLLGVLAGEMAVSYWQGHPEAVSSLLHRKSFALDEVQSRSRPRHAPPPNSRKSAMSGVTEFLHRPEVIVHATAWPAKLPVADLRNSWGALGCACWAV